MKKHEQRKAAILAGEATPDRTRWFLNDGKLERATIEDLSRVCLRADAHIDLRMQAQWHLFDLLRMWHGVSDRRSFTNIAIVGEGKFSEHDYRRIANCQLAS